MTTGPYGTWPSPLSAARLASGQVGLGNLIVDGQRLLWTEARPEEQGRQALVAWDPTGEVRDLVGPDVNVRTRVHEYGGAPISARDGLVVASEFATQRLHRVVDGDLEALTPAPDRPAGLRYADGRIVPDGQHLVCVRERHEGGEPANEIVAIDLADGAVTVLVSGRDFVAAPRPSPDGTRLAWLAWDHPYMPWDAAEIHVAPLTRSSGGGLEAVDGGVTRIGGGLGDAAACPVWTSEGDLLVSLDGSGFWEVHRWDGEVLEQESRFGADVGFPGWQFGSSAIAPLPDGRIACTVVEYARCRVEVLAPDSTASESLDLPYVWIERIQSFGDGVAFLGVRPDGPRAVVTWTPDDGAVERRAVDLPDLRPGDRATAEPVQVDLPDGSVTHAFLYRPANADHDGPDSERPPLVVSTHGGPTGNTYPALNATIAYWTTRGFAVADVNYRGSTGYGRAYRDALLQRWGEVDVVDTMAVARELARRGDVDGDRMAIRGGSAGGFTTLAVLTSPDHPFACGASYYGVADLELLAEHTHKFESRYMDRCVGPLPEARDLYVERSPLHHVDRLSCPVLVLQGLEDEVVPPEQAEAIVAAATDRGLPHAYLAFEGEQHGFRRAQNIVTALESELAFYGRVMGFDPAGDLPDLDLS